MDDEELGYVKDPKKSDKLDDPTELSLEERPPTEISRWDMWSQSN
jgi:hypothetical protein